MKLRAACVGACLIFFLLLAGCGGGGGSASPPAKGADVCDKLNDADRFRYTLSYVLDSPRQENPPPDPKVNEPGGEFVLKPNQPSLHLESKYDGAFQQPNRADIQLSTPNQPDQPAVRIIRIGEGQYALLGDKWQVSPSPVGFPWTPPTMCDAFISPLDLGGTVGTIEDLSGTKARHYRLNGAPLSAGAQIFGKDSDFAKLLTQYDVDLWVTEKENRPVKLQAVSRNALPSGRTISWSLSLDIGSYNDDKIDIKSPI